MERSKHCDYHKNKLSVMPIEEAQRIWEERNADNNEISGTDDKKDIALFSSKFKIQHLNLYYFIISYRLL